MQAVSASAEEAAVPTSPSEAPISQAEVVELSEEGVPKPTFGSPAEMSTPSSSRRRSEAIQAPPKDFEVVGPSRQV